MGLSVRGDPSHPGGGYAILTSDGTTPPAELAIGDRASELFLNEAGQWTRRRALLTVSPIDSASVRLGPLIVNAIASDLAIAFYSADGAALGALVWPATVRPGAGAGGDSALPDLEELGLGRRPVETPIWSPPRPAPPPLEAPIPPRPADAAPYPIATPKQGPPPPKPAPPPPAGSWKPLATILATLLIAGAAILFLRDSDLEQKLVCDPAGPLYGKTVYGLLAPCHTHATPRIEPPPQSPAPPRPDPEDEAYGDFLRCAAGKSGCPARDCANAFVNLFPHGKHVSEVDGIRRAADQQCAVKERETREAQIDADLQACLAGKSDCEKYACFDQYQGSLTLEPFVSSMRRSRQEAAANCEAQRQTERAYAWFSDCVTQSGPCRAGECDQRFGSSLHVGQHAADVQRMLDEARAACVPTPPPPPPPPAPPPSVGPTPETAARDFLEKYYRIHAGMGRSYDGSFDDLYAGTVNWYGAATSHGEVVAKKMDFFRQYSDPHFRIRPGTLQIMCDNSGDTCRVTALVDSSFRKNSTGTEIGGAAQVDFTFADVLTNPRVVSEWAKKYP